MSHTTVELSIAPVTPGDWPGFCSVRLYPVQRRFVPTNENIQAQFVFGRKNGKPPFELYLIRCDDRVVGFFTLTTTDDGFLWLGGFQVDAGVQHRGIGREVIGLIFQLIAGRDDYQGLMLNVHYHNKSVVRFYQRLGLALVGMIEENDELLWLMQISRENVIRLAH